MKPILFNTEMVRAILNGRKTVMRRVVKPQPVCYGPNVTFKPHDDDFFLSAEKNWLRCRVCGHDPEYSREGSNTSHHWIPPYRPGDILYVRETWAAWSRTMGTPPVLYYKADGNAPDGIKWHPSIHMPREAARIFLRVTDVRVEWLKDMQPYDIASEGFRRQRDFMEFWNSTLKPADRALYGWDANPWVWVIEFERIEKEDIPCE